MVYLYHTQQRFYLADPSGHPSGGHHPSIAEGNLMIADFVRRFIAGPLAKLASRLPFEPVVLAGIFIQGLLLVQDQLKGGADLETALTAAIIALGTWIVRQNVWPVAAIDASTATPIEKLEAPITGYDPVDYQ